MLVPGEAVGFMLNSSSPFSTISSSYWRLLFTCTLCPLIAEADATVNPYVSEAIEFVKT